MDCSVRGRYGMILRRDLLTALVLNWKFSDYVIEANDAPFKGLMTPMVDMGRYKFKDLKIEKIKPEKSFTNSYAE